MSPSSILVMDPMFKKEKILKKVYPGWNRGEKEKNVKEKFHPRLKS